ncbi:uncharacterized protein LOC34622245 [Cyclospora cayetanensis]|uniref:Uncharacterized protein LOC34622245 n=1 Tax=Cyclospora cayetanensis TaxID=88456 RepID=A0A6P6RSX0_9EIME|nr:uncharacterized protein LOC34622245 [Cyclospora cayetanensis]
MRREDTNKSAQGVPTNPSDPSVSTTTTTPGKGHRQGRSNVEGDIEFPRSQEPHRVSTKSHEGAHHSQFSSFSRTESSPCDCFFASEPPPPNVATAGLRVRQFVRPLQEKKELLSVRVAVVTAGGTDVPLEREAVRYLTNTSSGTRGAALCEQLLMLGYYVIFLTSVRAVKPFVRHLLPAHPMPHILHYLSLAGVPQQAKRQETEEEDEVAEEGVHELHAAPIITEPPPDAVSSEGELPVPAAASTSRRLASQASTEGPQGATVTSLGSVVSSSDSLAAAQERASYEEGSASDGVEVEEASEARDGWRVVFREPRQRGGDDYEALEGLGGPPDPVDALGWMLDPVEAAAALQLYRQCKDRLLCISYQTLVEYAFLVRAVAAGTCSLKERLMFCSAAAVADFYVPYALMAPHKIVASHDHGGPLSHHPSSGSVGEATSKEAGGIEVQGPSRSSSGAGGSHPRRWFTGSFLSTEDRGTSTESTSLAAAAAAPAVEAAAARPTEHPQHHPQQPHYLNLRLHLVPKMLLVVRSVAPNCFLVGFKLETNPERLQQSALAYLEGPRPGGPSGAPEASGVADCVVGNLQQTRRAVVKLFTRAGQKELKQKHKPKPGCLGHGTIEARLSRYLSKLHTQKMDEGLV